MNKELTDSPKHIFTISRNRQRQATSRRQGQAATLQTRSVLVETFPLPEDVVALLHRFSAFVDSADTVRPVLRILGISVDFLGN